MVIAGRYHPSFGQELIGASDSQGQDGCRAVFHLFRRLVRPLQAAIVIARVYSGCEHPSD
jgi:hypothetical protein